MYDRNGNPIDTTSVIDASTIPIGLTSWKIDRLFGNRTEIPVDTLQHNFKIRMIQEDLQDTIHI